MNDNEKIKKRYPNDDYLGGSCSLVYCMAGLVDELI